MPVVLSLWRRHEKDCTHRSKGRQYTKCPCPVWCDGMVGSERVRQSMDTRDWGRAGRKLAEIEQACDAPDQTASKLVADACQEYLDSLTLELASGRKYRHRVKCLASFCEERGISMVDEIELTTLDEYRKHRSLSPLTWSKELQFLRGMFGFWLKRKWISENHAKEMQMPRKPKGAERMPYSPEEITSIIAACGRAGAEAYERLRWRALVLLMRFYGLRVSDACTLERGRVKARRIAIRAMKNNRWLWMPLYSEVEQALEYLPLPSGAESKYFFWTGAGKREIHINNTIMSLASVYRASGVPNASSHRFRHTLTMELLSKGATVEDVADILGDNPDTIRRHYKHWMPEYQERASELLARVHGAGTLLAREKSYNGSNLLSTLRMAEREGFEPIDTSEYQQVVDNKKRQK